MIETLAAYGLEGGRIPGLTGVWIGDSKVAALGIKVKRWVTLHGLSLNVCTDMRYFHNIVPCGISNKAVASMDQYRPEITISDVSKVLVEKFSKVFGVEISADDHIANLLDTLNCD